MIVVKIVGGLASQIDKYLYTKKIADDIHTELVLDLSDYFSGYFRPFWLHLFMLPESRVVNGLDELKNEGDILEISNGDELIEWFEKRDNSNIYLSMEDQDYLSFFVKYPQYRINVNHPYIQMIKLQKRSKVVDDFSDKIRNIFSVGVHIRRGDFVTLGWDKNEDMYMSAIGYVKSLHPDARFYFFSNDIEWVKMKFGYSDFFFYIDEMYLERNDVEEFMCLAQCNMRIISVLSGYGKLSNYLSVVNTGSIGAIVLDSAGDENGVNQQFLKTDQASEINLTLEQCYIGNEVYRNISKKISKKSHDNCQLENNGFKQEKCYSCEGKCNIVVVTVEKRNRWLINGDYKLAYMLSKHGYRVTYLRMDYREKEVNALTRAMDMDGVDLGFDMVCSNGVRSLNSCIRMLNEDSNHTFVFRNHIGKSIVGICKQRYVWIVVVLLSVQQMWLVLLNVISRILKNNMHINKKSIKKRMLQDINGNEYFDDDSVLMAVDRIMSII